MMEVSFSRTESDNEEVLLPISTLFPPNELISKKYAPDVKPAFKLIQAEKKLARRVTFNNDICNDYCQIFRQEDTLGYQYLQLFKTGLVYLKFNNKNFLKLNLKNKTFNYFAGMFLPLENLLSQEIKQSKNVYKTLPCIDYIENSPSIEQSFNANCFSEEPQLRFSSNYDSSNLFAAFKRPDGEYDLVLQNDINSRGNTQWFNFTVEIFEDKIIKFNIVNLTKSASLYQKGMSVVLLSQQNKVQNKIGWTRGCFNISYTQTHVTRQDNDRSNYYKLHFQYKPNFSKDVVTFAYCYPYTFLDMERYFQKILFKKIVHSLRIEKNKICETLSGFPVYAYSIINKKNMGKKSFSSKYFDQITLNLEPKATPTKSIVFIARQHPGESQGSYVLEGIVDFLMENNDYQSYKKNYNFYIIPMVNIDGVFYGNYRTNLSGNDLNRVWRHPRKEYHSQVYYIKKYLISANKISPISLIIDIHGHSNSLNSFFYGNPPKKDANPSCQNPKLFPYFCSKRVRQISFNQSTFSISEDKKNCARVVLSQMFPKALVYTFQNSFYGWKKGKNIIQHTMESFRKLGRDLVLSYLQYCRLGQKNIGIKQKWTKQIEQLIKDPKTDEEEIVSESDSQAQNELIEFVQMESLTLRNHTSVFRDDNMTDKFSSNKKLSASTSKNNLMRYLRKGNQMSKAISSIDGNILAQKINDSGETPAQGFLSIVKINAKSTPNQIGKQVNQKLEIKNSKNSKKIENQDLREKYEDEIKHSILKESATENFVKVGKLISQKEMALQKLRQKKLKIQEFLSTSKSYNNFLKTTNYPIDKKFML